MEGGEEFSWPEDMELRRMADLENFYRKNPDYKQVMSEEPQEANEKQSRDRKARTPGSRSSGSPPLSSGKKKHARASWTLESTLELLEAMKAYVRANKIRCLGIDIQKWKAIAKRVPNPCGEDRRTFARTCQVRFQNMRRTLRNRPDLLRVEVKRSLQDYLQFCGQNQARGSKAQPKAHRGVQR